MNDLTLIPPRQPTTESERVEPVHRSLTPRILAHEHRLLTTKPDIEQHRRLMDGAILGFVGLDGATALLPGVNPIINAYSMLKLTSHAVRIHAGIRTILAGILMVLVDILFGIAWGVGDLVDLLWRSSSYYGRMLNDRIEEQLLIIEAARERGREQGYLTEADITRLEDTLFRGGKSRGAVQLRLLILLGIVGFLLYSCVD